jgi:hypothetical protein
MHSEARGDLGAYVSYLLFDDCGVLVVVKGDYSGFAVFHFGGEHFYDWVYSLISVYVLHEVFLDLAESVVSVVANGNASPRQCSRYIYKRIAE